MRTNEQPEENQIDEKPFKQTSLITDYFSLNPKKRTSELSPKHTLDSDSKKRKYEVNIIFGI